ncbi:hypothetical protein DV735_g4635, partial [Chaetothyriales sp. CBS 134920]
MVWELCFGEFDKDNPREEVWHDYSSTAMPLTPVIIGVGDVVNRSTKVEDAREPLDLILEAVQDSIKDTGISSASVEKLRSSIDSIDVVATWTWPYHDLPGSIAKELGVEVGHKHYTPHGGNQPGKIFDDAARRISQGKTKVGLCTGAEALASYIGAAHDIGVPIHVYPLYENAFRAHRRQTIKENNDESARLYADFAKVAEKQKYSWNYGKEPANPLLMNAFNTVNLAGAVLLTSTEYARELGVPESKWIYALGGAGTEDSHDFWLRPAFYSSPSISQSLDAGIAASSLSREDIDLFDFYSCFPIVPKLAANHLGLSLDGYSDTRPFTLLGGLTSFGGAGNNYSMHAITEMTRALRSGRGKNGLILANGGVLTYQFVICLSSQPRKDGGAYPQKNPLPETVTNVPVPRIEENPEGEAVIETYTVEFNRDGTPLRGHVVGRLKERADGSDASSLQGGGGARFLANHADEATLKQLASTAEEPIGRTGWVRRATAADGYGDDIEGRNVFTFQKPNKL